MIVIAVVCALILPLVVDKLWSTSDRLVLVALLAFVVKSPAAVVEVEMYSVVVVTISRKSFLIVCGVVR